MNFVTHCIVVMLAIFGVATIMVGIGLILSATMQTISNSIHKSIKTEKVY